MGEKLDSRLKSGDVQRFKFRAGDPPPFYDLGAPPKNVHDGRKIRIPTPGEGAGFKTVYEPLVGYEGKSKGLRQVLWKRGLWREGMKANVDPISDLNINTALGNCSDFKEKSALQHLVESRGHILVMSPKFHPEIAGVGIEYSWGKSKLEFRRNINDENPKNLKDNTLKVLNTDTIRTLDRVRRFARQTRDYRRSYERLGDAGDDLDQLKLSHDGAEGFRLMEKMAASRKAHRNIVDMEVSFLDAA